MGQSFLGTAGQAVAAGWRALVAGAFTLALAAQADEFRAPVPELCRHYAFGEAQGPSDFNLGSCMATVAVIRVEISGTHADGWWDGDDVEDEYHGPAGGCLLLEMNPEAGFWETWFQRIELSGNGAFHHILTLRTPMDEHRWEFLRNGCGDLVLTHPYLAGFGGFTIEPEVTVTSLSVIVEGEPAPARAPVRITALQPDGTLSWTGAPATGLTRVEFAPQADGPWTEVAVVPAAVTTCQLALPPGRALGFFRVRCSEE